MKAFICKKGTASQVIFIYLIVVDFLVLSFMHLIDIYEVIALITIFLIVLNIYGIYYLLLALTLKYTVDDEKIHITGLGGLKSVKIFLSSIEGYKKSNDVIRGIRLFGVGNKNFALGRYVIDNIGTTWLFVTCRKNSIYLKTKEMNYAISPKEMQRFTDALREHDIKTFEWEYTGNKEVCLHKEKSFMIPFIVVSAVIFLSTIIPLILYIKRLIPNEMPLSLNANFQPEKMGTGKQYAFKQMIYGVLNMAILFCMYYAAYFHAKYDKKSANIYIYASLIVAVVFFLLQIRTIFQYIV